MTNSVILGYSQAVRGHLIRPTGQQRLFTFWGSLASLAFLVLTTACGPSLTQPTYDPHDAEHLEGKLTPIVASFKSGRGFSHCDEVAYNDMQTIAEALDERAESIDSYLRSQTQTPQARLYALGPIMVEKSPPLSGPGGVQQWEVQHFSWSDIRGYYDYAVDKPTMANWLVVNRLARGVLTDDVSRIHGGYPYALGHEHEAMIQNMLKVCADCAQSTHCSQPSFTSAEWAWLSKQPRYSERIATLTQSSRYSARWATALDTLQAYLRQDALRYTFYKNPSMRRDGDRLVLPLFAGLFADVGAQLAAVIEPYWTRSSAPANALALKIEWRSTASSDLFSVLAGGSPGGRSSVSFTKREMTLESGVRERSIAHEIGHVIGFRDQYYTLWDEERCEYTDEYRRGDLMADASDGVVTDAEWATLLATYPNP